MKKLILLLTLIIPFVSGCASIDSQLSIKDDKSATITNTLIYSGDLSSVNDVNAQALKKVFPNYIDSSYITTENFGADESKIISVKKVDNVETKNLDLSSLGFTSNLPDNKFIEVKRNFLVSTYNIDMVLKLSDKVKEFNMQKFLLEKNSVASVLQPVYLQKYENNEDILDIDKQEQDDMISNLDNSAKSLTKQDVTEPSTYQQNVVDNNLKMTFSIKVPSFSTYNNADSFVGTTYSWNIDPTKDTVIKFQYVRYSGFAIFVILFFGISFLIYFAYRIRRKDSQKRVDNIQNIV